MRAQGTYLNNTEEDIISLFAALGLETEEKRIKARQGMSAVYLNCDDATATIEEQKGTEHARVE